jgi:peptidoglycan recognition protein
MTIISRSDWGALPPRNRVTMPLPAPNVWLHHTGADEPDGPEGMRRIQTYHLTKWSDIGYSFVIDREGRIFEGRGPGIVGAHTAGHNSTSHGICLIGNYDRDQPTSAAIESLVWLMRHGAGKWWPSAKITGGHRDKAATACPGANLYRMIPGLNERLSSEEREPTRHEHCACVAKIRKVID